ncbi:Rne/Rng family ribonuclease [Buchnera aphidicola]|uniref:Rne/Rng family ribonuclease n=1 Tax=Buchnera aphidicola TaxID=9 RepID=UPI00130E8F36
MKRMLINTTQKEELRIALVDGEYLYDLDIEHTKHKQKKSNIYKGKVTKVEPSLEAAFIDYGTKKNGFLPLKEICSKYFSNTFSDNSTLKIKDVLKEGQELIVQVDKEERGKKGALLTTYVCLVGSYLILMPNNPGTKGISKKILGSDRVEVKYILSTLNFPKKMGIIIRTAGLGKSTESLQWDLSFCIKHWNNIKKIANSKPAPCLIYQENDLISRSFRDYLKCDISEILIDDQKSLTLARKHMKILGRSDFINKIKLYTGNIPLFSYFQVESQINLAFQREIKLSSGGVIIIDHTEALTAIDVDSSQSTKGINIEETALNTNLEAVKEISRQLRLRNLSGLIVIDFIDMILLKNQKIVEDVLKKFVKKDRARVQISSISQFGLLELSRQRLNYSLYESNYQLCSQCYGIGKIRNKKSLSLYILRLIEIEVIKDDISEVHAIVPIDIACYLLNEKRKDISNIENKQKGKKAIIIPNKKFKIPFYSILSISKNKKNNFINYHFPNSCIKKENYFFNISKVNFVNKKIYFLKKYVMINNFLKNIFQKIIRNFIFVIKFYKN